ncbi:hypothetical protein OG21DRAFT_1502143 [Imleria badia]|nr:hypothetical protein OG21DRAFT_1502143 [Imleria badia]
MFHSVAQRPEKSTLNPILSEPSIFRALAAHQQDQYFKDMDCLRVRRPDLLTHVTEYVPEIVEFVKRIMENGYAYEDEGSVYFNTVVFDSSENHPYAMIEHWSKGNRELIAEGEGWSLGKYEQNLEMMSKFTQKPGESAWPSPWGPGRPGWHIESSVMATAVLCDNLDIHSGVVDLAFPLHDNEIAQSEAYHECNAWASYFAAQTQIVNQSISRNQDILQKFTPRQLLLAFLTQLWNAKVDFSDSLMIGEVKTTETTFNNFFVIVKALLLNESKLAFRVALCDSLVSRTNIYINTRRQSLNVALVEQSARWTGDMLRMFGLDEREKLELGWGQETVSDANVTNREELLAIAKQEDSLKEILKLCDWLRDEDLVPLGVALDGQEDGKVLVKLIPPPELIKARDEKRQKLEDKAARKVALAQAEEEERLTKLEKGRTPPGALFKPPNVPEGTYSQWDEQGIPTADGEGGKLNVRIALLHDQIDDGFQYNSILLVEPTQREAIQIQNPQYNLIISIL